MVNRHWVFRFVGLWVSVGALLAESSASAGEGLWYTEPAEVSLKGWENASMPIGNGWFGASVYGQVKEDRVQISHNAVYNTGFITLTKTKQREIVLSDALGLAFSFDGSGAVADYRRSLDFASATAKVTFTRDGVKHEREYFMSYPDKVLVMRFKVDRPKALAFTLATDIPEADVTRHGQSVARGDTLDTDQELVNLGEKIASRARIVSDGSVTAKGDSLRVEQASEVTVYFALDTNYRLESKTFLQPSPKRYTGPDPRPEIESRLDRAVEKGYAAIRRDHLKDFAALYGRVVLELPDTEADRQLPTDKLVKQAERGMAGNWLTQCLFQYGRYLMISSSRKGALPPNLQGVWNIFRDAPFGGAYFHNLNIQMNYWPVFVANLSECFEPYVDYHRAYRPHGRVCSIECLQRLHLYDRRLPMDANAWCVGTASGIFHGGYPAKGGNTGPGAVGFTSRMFIDWWEFTQNRAALEREVYPVLRGAADFLSRIVVATNGLYLSAISPSPEQFVYKPDPKNLGRRIPTRQYYQSLGCAFDQQMIDENNRTFLNIHEMLGKPDDELVCRVRKQVGKYEPVLIGLDGQIKEFREEEHYGDIGEKHHRHISHLMGLYPGDSISVKTPEYLKAARVTLDRRGDADSGCGWGMAYRVCCWARVGDGERAWSVLNKYAAIALFDNLWNRHGRTNIKPCIGMEVYQIDGNFGITAGIAEMLVQSRLDEFRFLPALPKAWAKHGRFKGLCIRGGQEVDCEWRNGKIVSSERRPVRYPTGD